MKLIEALQVVNDARRAELPTESTHLVCGFTPLHLQTFLTAALQLRSPDVRVVLQTGIYGDLIGNLERASHERAAGAAVVVEWSDLDPRLGLRSTGGWSPTALPDILESARAMLRRLVTGMGRTAEAMPTVVCMPTLPLPPVAYTPGWEGSAFELALQAAVAEAAAEVASIPRLRVVNAQRLALLSPPGERGDPRAEFGSGFPYTQAHAASLADQLTLMLRRPAPKKGLITDLDDTLWRGILGEVGVDGVAWNLERRAHGHALYQQLLASLADAGTLVAVASKNDPELAERALARGDHLLRRERIFPVLAHWKAKSESVRAILASWNIGADSVVFVDDSPMELAEVQAQHPDVECRLFPKDDPVALVRLLVELRDLFGKSELLEEDRLRLDSLRSAATLAELGAGDGDAAEAFLSRAEAEVTVDFRREPPDPRAFELLNKTNQFNLNGRRITEAEWIAYLGRDDGFMATVSYRDKFGALGKIAVVVGRTEGTGARLEHWVLSCRAFARRIEHQCLRMLFEQLAVDEITLDFAPTERNGPTREFLAELLGAEAVSAPASAPTRITRQEFELRCRPLYHTVRALTAHEAQHG